MDISDVIRNLFNERGYEIIKSPKVFCSIVDDLAFEAQKERAILRRVLTIYPDVCNKIYNLLTSRNTDIETQLNIFKYELNEIYGVSEKWIHIFIELFFQKTDDSGQNKISLEAQKNNSFESTNEETKITSRIIERIQYSNGDVFEGETIDGKRTGRGKYIWDNGDIYEGDFINGKRTGKGKLLWSDGDVYEGDFVDGNRTGKGRFIWKDSGNIYEGDFINGKRTGKGKFLWSDGDIYEGDFVDGNRTGKGRLIEKASGNIYEGDFTNGRISGKGKLLWLDGDIYEGDFVDGNLTGKGKYIWGNGDCLVSRFKDGICLNTGEYRGIDNNIFIGEMIEKPFGSFFQGKWETPNGIRYEGAFSSTSRSKWGAYVTLSNYRDRIRDIIENSFTFNGKIVWPNGDIFEGSCTNLKPYDGKGVWHSNYGNVLDRVEKGRWKEGTKKRF